MKFKVFIFFLFSIYLSAQDMLPKGFVYVESFIPSIKVDLRYTGTHNFIGIPIDGYNREVVILTESATMALKKVQDELEDYNLSILVYDAYRPQRAVDHFVRWARDLNDTINKQYYYPNVPKNELFKREYIASHSRHSKGSTLDITLVDKNTCEPLDMGTPYDFFGNQSWVTYQELTTQQLANRMLLQTIMRKYGFMHYPQEWWHFTLRDEPFPNTYFDFIVE
ncbi:MAG: M15 family metallopeptidase [Flavobacteriaceae bacterium]|nr:M15 family metallopeptidase [Flavobacteriaceae bacterium]